MNQVMLDTETLGTRQDSAFISIGACLFDPNTGEIGETVYQNIDWDDALKKRGITGATIKWWLRQSKEAQNRVCAPGKPLKEVLKNFGRWFREGDPERRVWGNGATFDVSLMENAYLAEFGVTPWAHWNVRDVRTIMDVGSNLFNKADIPFEGTQHDALADAIHQAKYVSKMWQLLRRVK